MILVFLGIAAFLATLFGGLFALRFRDHLHLILSYSAGAVLGVALFDLLPEALALSGQSSALAVTAYIAVGFSAFMILDRFLLLHPHEGGDHHELHQAMPALAYRQAGGRQARGQFGAGSLSIHSFMDGLAIGLAFQVSAAVGAVVTVAVLAHDFSDGINTISLILKNNGTKRQAFRWLFVDALAPAAGVAATLLFTVPAATLGSLLALFCGFFLYIGASDLLPESYHRHPHFWTTCMTILGMLTLYVVVRVVG